MTWLLLIYTVPAQPSRKRAAIWRDIKRAGAVYLRDGVCALPETPSATKALKAIGDKVQEFGGRASLAQGVQLDQRNADALFAAARSARRLEYFELTSELQGFLLHVREELEHRHFSNSELDELEGDLKKLRQWAVQIATRDFAASTPAAVEELIERCESEVADFLAKASQREGAAP